MILQPRLHTIIQLSVQQGNQREVIRRIVLAFPQDLWLVSQGIPDGCEASLQQGRKTFVLGSLRLGPKGVESKNRSID